MRSRTFHARRARPAPGAAWLATLMSGARATTGSLRRVTTRSLPLVATGSLPRVATGSLPLVATGSLPLVAIGSLLLVAISSLPLVAAGSLLLAGSASPARAACVAPSAGRSPDDADSPAELLDRPARAWTFDRWVDSAPLTLESLRGKVVLVRWFNTGCHYCGNTLPALEALRTRYAAQGLVVVGVFHPKPIHRVSDAFVRRSARKLGFNGPLAVDERWSTLNRWWLANHPERNWTSVSFLIDRQGIVRWAHGGGEYHPSNDPRHASCDARYAELERTIRRLLGDRAAAR